MIAAIGYQNGTLAVLFHNNPTTYTLHCVPYSLFVRFLNASSHGAFWNRHLRGKFK
ncbi:MAG TPA: KTSC domain-containing protein [Verrucomicrobiae bacterium]|nr:KTSC domain-containing protein [Verrucomicrobiae bacterium]